MPHTYFAQLWLDARRDLERLLELDKIVQEGKPIKKKNDAIIKTLEFYYRYRKIVQRLTDCHDQIVQPQIRELAGKMLDYSIVRMLEYRQEIVGLTLAECPWPNEVLIRLKYSPDDVELSGPVYEAAARQAELERRKKIADDMIAATNARLMELASETSMTSLEEDDPSKAAPARRAFRKPAASDTSSSVATLVPKESPEEQAERERREAEFERLSEAMLLIQKHERARVGRVLAIRLEKQIIFNRRVSTGELKVVIHSKDTLNQAATVIQKTWRGFVGRRKVKRIRDGIDEALGITIAYWKPPDLQDEYEANFHERLEMQMDAVREMGDITAREKKKIWAIRGPSLIEDIRDELREWFILWFNEIGVMDHIPPAADGGSALIATGQVRTPREYQFELATRTTEKKKDNKPKEEENEEEEEEKKEPEGWIPQESKAYPFLIKANEEFLERFSFRTEQILDPKGGLIVDMIREDLYCKLQLEMRAVADEQMREQLAELHKALLLDHEADGPFFFIPAPQNFNEDENGNGKKKKPPKEKIDPYADITEDELMVDLTRWEVIKETPKCRLSDWPGAETYNYDKFREVRMGDIKHPLMDYCVLPYVSKAVNQLAPFYKTICLCGPGPSGQHFLAEAVCSELRATVFDLTPEHHAKHFQGKEATNKLVYAVVKLAKILAPSIILVESESAWLKKVPHQLRRVKPKRFAGIYKRIVKEIEPGDQVLFLTTSAEPYMAGNAFVKFHDKFIIIPVCDYGTLYLAYKKALMSHEDIDRQLDVSCLAKVMSEETPLGLAQELLRKCLGVARRCTMRVNPFSQHEILEARIAPEVTPTAKDLEAYQKFRWRIPLEKQRKEMLEEELEELGDTKNAKKK